MTELVYVTVSKTVGKNALRVRASPLAPYMKYKVTQEIELSIEEFNLLKELYNNNRIEYEDPEFLNIEAFRLSKLSKLNEERSEEWFLKRNHNGTHHLMANLYEKNLVEPSVGSWSAVYFITELGMKLIEQNP